MAADLWVQPCTQDGFEQVDIRDREVSESGRHHRAHIHAGLQIHALQVHLLQGIQKSLRCLTLQCTV